MRKELATASDLVREAADEAADDVAARLADQADQLAALAERDRGPDHGRLARHQHVLGALAADADDATAARVVDAVEHVRAYRETVSGI